MYALRQRKAALKSEGLAFGARYKRQMLTAMWGPKSGSAPPSPASPSPSTTAGASASAGADAGAGAVHHGALPASFSLLPPPHPILFNYGVPSAAPSLLFLSLASFPLLSISAFMHQMRRVTPTWILR